MKPYLYYRAYFLAFLSSGYISGITISAWSSISAEIIIGLSLLTFFISVVCQAKKLYLAASFACIALFVCAGILHGTVTSSPPQENSHIYNLIQQPTDSVITGHLKTMPSFDGTTAKVLIKLHSVRLGADQNHIPAQGTVLLQMRFPWPGKYEPGTFLAIRTVLKRPGQYKTPGSFDYPRYLAEKGIWVTGSIRSETQITAVKKESDDRNTLLAAPEIIRTRIGQFLDEAFSENDTTNGLYRAILLGDRSRLPDHAYEGFKASGLAHILAVSGLHLSTITVLLFFSIRKILTLSTYLTLHLNVKKSAGLLLLPLLIGYSYLAGLNSPVLRACIMAIVVLIALFTNKVQTISLLISAAAMLLLTIDPQSLFTVSFQLSFAAVLSICLFAPAISSFFVHPQNHIQAGTAKQTALKFNRWLLAGLFTSTAAVLGTLPIVLFYFHRFPVFGPLANLLVEPAICLWSLPLGILSIPFMPLSSEVAEFLLSLGSSGLLFSCRITSLIEQVPFNSIWTAPPSPPVIIAHYTSCILAAWSLKKRSPHQLAASIPLCITLFLLLIPNLTSSHKTPGHEIAVSFLDVGQGSSAVLEFTDGRTVLLDGGGSGFSRTLVGESVIAPFLWHKGITKLDGIIVTHPDADHYNGLPFLIDHFSPGFIWTSALTSNETGYDNLLTLCRRRKVSIQRPEKGESLRFADSVLHCLANTVSDKGFPADSNGGLIIQLVHKDLTILFPGDIREDTEQILVQDKVPLESDLLLAAHHGSATSNSQSLLERVSPKAVIVSSGLTKKHLFPSKKLISYCSSNGVPLWQTAEHGTITVTYKKGKKEIHLMEEWQSPRNPLERMSRSRIPVQEIRERKGNRQAPFTPL